MKGRDNWFHELGLVGEKSEIVEKAENSDNRTSRNCFFVRMLTLKIVKVAMA